MSTEFLFANVLRNENDLPEELRVFQRCRFQQSRQTCENRLFPVIRNHHLHEHLTLRLASQDSLDPFKALERVLRVPQRDIFVLVCIERGSLRAWERQLESAIP